VSSEFQKRISVQPFFQSAGTASTARTVGAVAASEAVCARATRAKERGGERERSVCQSATLTAEEKAEKLMKRARERERREGLFGTAVVAEAYACGQCVAHENEGGRRSAEEERGGRGDGSS